MKSKKVWIFWICYYTIMLAANVLALIFFREHIQISWLSLISIIESGFFVAATINPVYFFCAYTYGHCYRSVPKMYEIHQEYFDELIRICGQPIRTLSMLFPPLYLPSVFFFTYLPKLLIPTFLSMGLFLFMSIYTKIQEIKNEREKDKQLQKELKEQQQREELGKWK